MVDHSWGYQDNMPRDNVHLLGGMFAWIERDVDARGDRVVFYDFDNDEGMSLDLDEWRTAVEWWVSLDASTADSPSADATLAAPRQNEG